MPLEYRDRVEDEIDRLRRGRGDRFRPESRRVFPDWRAPAARS
jgi:hypothetical protein